MNGRSHKSTQPASIPRFIAAIRKLPEDKPVVTPGKWYRTQKEHWLGWLSDYGGPGAYRRKGGSHQDARFAYNHIVEPKMLLWLISAAGIDTRLVSEAKRAAAAGTTMAGQSAAVRKAAPWDVVAASLWPSKPMRKS